MLELNIFRLLDISPGPINLVALIDPNNRSVGAPVYSTDKEREGELQLYSQFPMFPTGMSQDLDCIIRSRADVHVYISVHTRLQRRP